MSMFTVYVDDSGTNNNARVVTGAVCVSSVQRWKAFERKWKKIAVSTGFKHFHMTEFAGCRPDKFCRDCINGKKSVADHPWRTWTEKKRERILASLAETVNRHVDMGFGIAVTKQDYDDLVLNAPLKTLVGDAVGKKHHTFTIQLCGGAIRNWRLDIKLKSPMKYIFDTTDDLIQRSEIAAMFIKSATDTTEPLEHGFSPTGYAFESRKDTVQLLSADMLAWASAKARVSELFNTQRLDGLSKEAKIVIKTFVDGKKLTIANINRKQLETWANKETEFRKNSKLAAYN